VSPSIRARRQESASRCALGEFPRYHLRELVLIERCSDNVLTARSIATQCGIYTPGGIIMEGSAFRKLTVAERNEIVPRLQVCSLFLVVYERY
jgi:hypothetical protein